MGSPSRKDEVLEQISATHLLLEAHLSSLNEAQMTEPGVNGEWSVKDMLAHITWWEQHLLHRLRTGVDDFYQNTTNPQATTDEANAATFAANRSRPLSDIMDEFQDSYHELLTAIAALPEEMVEQAEIYDAIAWDTFRHYPEHAAMLQQWSATNASQE